MKGGLKYSSTGCRAPHRLQKGLVRCCCSRKKQGIANHRFNDIDVPLDVATEDASSNDTEMASLEPALSLAAVASQTGRSGRRPVFEANKATGRSLGYSVARARLYNAFPSYVLTLLVI